MVLGSLTAIVGGGLIAVGAQTDSSLIAIGVLLLIVGIGWYLFARIGAWWFHG